MKSKFIVIKSEDSGALTICPHKNKKERLDSALKELKEFLKFNRGSCFEITIKSIKRRKMEKKIEALLKKCEKETSKYIKEHKLQISALGKLLYEKKHLKSSEILSCIG